MLFVLILLVKANAQSYPVSVDSVAFLGDSVSTKIELGKNEFISDLFIPSSRTTAITMKVLLPDDTREWYFSEDGSDYSVSVDNSKNTVVTLPPSKFHSKKEIYLIITADPADTFYIPFTKRPF